MRRIFENPLARTLRSRLVSGAQPPRVAVDDGGERSVAEDCAESSKTETQIAEELDVRPLLERGDEPFKVIMAAITRVPEGGALRLRASFEPVPLYEVLARRGFSHSTRALAADDWEVTFSRDISDEAESSVCARASRESPVTESDEFVHLDVSDLVPPEPMVRILEAAAMLQPGQTLVVEHHRKPVYLYPQLDAQGFAHETNELGPGRVQILIRRA